MEASKTGNRHRGRQMKRFREAIGMKQQTLADTMGTTQQNISNYEKQEDLDDALFAQVAAAMGVSPDILKDFNTEAAVFNIQEMRENSQAIYHYNFNPIDKIMEQAKKIEELYEELLRSEREKIQILKNSTSGK